MCVSGGGCTINRGANHSMSDSADLEFQAFASMKSSTPGRLLTAGRGYFFWKSTRNPEMLVVTKALENTSDAPEDYFIRCDHEWQVDKQTQSARCPSSA